MSSSRPADQVVITGTGYFGAFRRQIRQLAWKLGAQYRGDLTHGVTTHLVCRDTALPDSEKVSVAHTWGVSVVQHRWLCDSVACQTVLPVHKYLIHFETPAPVYTSHSCDNIQAQRQPEPVQVEGLRAAEANAVFSLADLLLSNTLSPKTGDMIWHDTAADFCTGTEKNLSSCTYASPD